MKIIKLSLIIAMLTSTSYAKYDVVYPIDAPINFGYHDSKLVTEYGNWANSGNLYDCSSWSPLENTITVNQSFTQNSSCIQNQTRTAQKYMQSLTSGEKVPYGDATQETQTISATQIKESVGSLETWTPIDQKLVISDWTNSGAVHDCTNWTPATTTVDWQVAFTQTTSQCKQSQTRVVQAQEQETTTLAIRATGSQITENQDIAGSSSQSASGTRASITNNPLTRINTQSGTVGNGYVTTNGTWGALLYGPYVKDLPLGTYNLKIYGSTGETTGATFDMVNSGGNYSYTSGALPANASGLLVNVNVNISTLDQNYGVEVRVLSQSTTAATITGYELVKIN